MILRRIGIAKTIDFDSEGEMVSRNVAQKSELAMFILVAEVVRLRMGKPKSHDFGYKGKWCLEMSRKGIILIRWSVATWPFCNK
jgi:hypothetical protein